MPYESSSSVIVWVALLAIAAYGYFSASRNAATLDRGARRADGSRGIIDHTLDRATERSVASSRSGI